MKKAEVIGTYKTQRDNNKDYFLAQNRPRSRLKSPNRIYRNVKVMKLVSRTFETAAIAVRLNDLE